MELVSLMTQNKVRRVLAISGEGNREWFSSRSLFVSLYKNFVRQLFKIEMDQLCKQRRRLIWFESHLGELHGHITQFPVNISQVVRPRLVFKTQNPHLKPIDVPLTPVFWRRFAGDWWRQRTWERMRFNCLKTSPNASRRYPTTPSKHSTIIYIFLRLWSIISYIFRVSSRAALVRLCSTWSH